MSKLCSVMGVDVPYDPDPTYELTTDNVKKILAIYMRFRYVNNLCNSNLKNFILPMVLSYISNRLTLFWFKNVTHYSSNVFRKDINVLPS